MTQFVVDSEAVFGGAAAVRTMADQAGGQLLTLEAQLSTLQASWSGQAALAFQATIDEFRVALRQMLDSFGTIDRALTTAGQQYADVELVNAGLFRV